MRKWIISTIHEPPDDAQVLVATVVSILLLFAPLMIESEWDLGMFLQSVLIAYATLSVMFLAFIAILTSNSVVIKAARRTSRILTFQALITSVFYGVVGTFSSVPKGLQMLHLALIIPVAVGLFGIYQMSSLFEPIGAYKFISNSAFLLGIMGGGGLLAICSVLLKLSSITLKLLNHALNFGFSELILLVATILVVISAWYVNCKKGEGGVYVFSLLLGFLGAVSLWAFVSTLSSTYPSQTPATVKWVHGIFLLTLFVMIYFVLFRNSLAVVKK